MANTNKEYKLVTISDTSIRDDMDKADKANKVDINRGVIHYLGCFGCIQEKAVETMTDCGFVIYGKMYSCTLRADEVALVAACFSGKLDDELKRHLHRPKRKLVLLDILCKIYNINNRVILCTFCKHECKYVWFNEQFDNIQLCITCLLKWEVNKDPHNENTSFHFYEGKFKIYMDGYKYRLNKTYPNIGFETYGCLGSFSYILDQMFFADSKIRQIYRPIYLNRWDLKDKTK